MKNCLHCQAEADDAALTCGECGECSFDAAPEASADEAVDAAPEASAEQKPRKGRR